MADQRDKGLQHVGAIVKGLLPPMPPSYDQDLIRPEDLAYTHSIFLQCFMPLRHHPSNLQEWETGNRDAKLLMTAGRLIKPDKPGEFKKCDVPAGPKARIVATYVNDFAFRHKTRTIDLGKSLRVFMEKAGVPVGGRNGKELQREMENFAAARIYLGIWGVDQAHQDEIRIAPKMSFWLEKNPDQMAFWRPEMQLSQEYYDTLTVGRHLAPVHWPGLLALQRSPRAMDIFCFLSYRLYKPLKRPVVLSIDTLHTMFGKDCKRHAHFWPRFIDDLKKAHKHYPEARVEPSKDRAGKDCLILHSSPPLIPHRTVAYLGGG